MTARWRTVAYGALLVGTVGAFATGAQAWWQAAAGGSTAPLTGTVSSGSLSQALAVVTVAGLLLSLTLAARGRQILGAVLLLAGAGMVAVGVARPRPAADVVAEALRTVTLSVEYTLTGTAWPWIYAASGLLVALGGALLTVLAPRWETRRSRFERGAGPVDLDDATAVWKALDAGVDPTSGSALPSAEQEAPHEASPDRENQG
ncbi:Trp biosynthesis-associated membrane protein [Raineyella sp. LH-20]|uniref:Trp biosynthesis-associated membrane protein n=1 Tax=Raineyella sp. LH-20 TaxID=3081204 RepID=UPI002953AC8A|nr:Trp biosynthesis-associated membrane protein [Raineyella sp. LH-20]WOP17957.1 Trp biosynthesis-associated membrane protein [Raineyella sp. LH-20]